MAANKEIGIINNEVAILDSITEGYPVELTRNDGYRVVLSYERRRGDEFYIYQFGKHLKKEFKSWESLLNHLLKYTFTAIKF